MPTPQDDQMLRMDGWPGGVNNRMRETEQGAMRDERRVPSSQFLRKALNVDLTAEGHPVRRKGYALIEAGFAHSIWSSAALGLICWVLDGELFVGQDVTTAAAVASVNRYSPMSYTSVNDTIYYSNGQQLGEVYYDGSARNWGVPIPPTPTVSGPSAVAPEGYETARQVTATYVDVFGREGGAAEPVFVGADGSFQVSMPLPHPQGVREARIYVSQTNSEILYHARTVVAVGTVMVHDSDIGRGRELETLNRRPPVPGQLLCHVNGRVYIARNDYVSFSEALRFDLFRPSQGIYTFPDNVTLLEPSTDGIYVGTSRGVVFIAGPDPYDIRQVHVSPYAPISGTAARVPGEKFGVPVDEVPVWWGKDGVMVVGLPGGQLRQLTHDRLAVPSHAAGAVTLREQDGMSHIVSSLRQGAGENAMGATDTVVAEVRRNGISLNT